MDPTQRRHPGPPPPLPPFPPARPTPGSPSKPAGRSAAVSIPGKTPPPSLLAISHERLANLVRHGSEALLAVKHDRSSFETTTSEDLREIAAALKQCLPAEDDAVLHAHELTGAIIANLPPEPAGMLLLALASDLARSIETMIREDRFLPVIVNAWAGLQNLAASARAAQQHLAQDPTIRLGPFNKMLNQIEAASGKATEALRTHASQLLTLQTYRNSMLNWAVRCRPEQPDSVPDFVHPYTAMAAELLRPPARMNVDLILNQTLTYLETGSNVDCAVAQERISERRIPVAAIDEPIRSLLETIRIWVFRERNALVAMPPSVLDGQLAPLATALARLIPQDLRGALTEILHEIREDACDLVTDGTDAQDALAVIEAQIDHLQDKVYQWHDRLLASQAGTRDHG